MDTLRIRWGGGEASFDPGSTVRIGRDGDANVQTQNTSVSRHHAEVTHDGSSWTLRDLGSAQGTWRDGRQVETVDVRGTIQVTLGREGRGEVFTLESSPAGRALRPPTAAVLPAEATEVVSAAGSGQGFDVVGAGGAGGGTVIIGEGASGGHRPGGALRAEALVGATIVTGDALNVECGGKSYTFHPGTEVSIGRDTTCDIVSSNPTVSRRHALLRHDGTTWTLVDEQSAGGTYVDEQRISTYPLAGSVAAWLGDPTSGERLVIVARGTNPISKRRKRRQLWAPIAAAAAILAAGVAVFALTRDSGGSETSGPSLDHLGRATVRLRAGDFGGSGTIIDASEGLILTNAHVVAPSAVGSAVRDGLFDYELDPNVREIQVLVAPGLDRAAEPRFIAEVVAVDGYADLAVLKITKTTMGQLVEPGSDDLADLVDVEIADSTTLETGAKIRVFGYPSASDTPTVTVSEGVVSSPVFDERMRSNRAMFNISAQISKGNSGGLAVDDHGRLIGVPSLIRNDITGSMRPSEFAVPLIDAAKADEEYTSPFITERTDESLENLRIVAPGSEVGIDFDCITGDFTSLDRGGVGVAFDYDGFPAGEHQDLLVAVFSGDTFIGVRSLNQEWPVTWPEDSGCATITVRIDPSLVIDPALPLSATIGIGPDYSTRP